MPISPSAVLNQAVVDVQYSRGIVYLDKCGSLLLKLEDALGKPFEGSVPNMDHGELRSAAERLVLSYGAKNFTVTQAWMRSAARVEQVAPLAWEQVAETLGVGRTVSRCGVRHVFVWRAETHEEAENALTACRSFSLSGDWAALVGEGAQRGWAAVLEDGRGRMRIAMDVLDINVQGGALPEDLAAIVPKYAIMLDLDHVHPGRAPYSLSRAELKEFIRASWQRSKAARTIMHKALGLGADDGAREHTD